jgi:hypothetical protein
VSLDRARDMYYTAAEARAVLGLNENTFQTWVKTGRINRTMLPGRGQGVYRRAEIDRKARSIEAAMFFDETKDLSFRKATVSDMDAENHLAYLIFGKRAISPQSVEACRRLARISPESVYHLYDRDSLVASIDIVPLKHDAIIEFINGKRGWLLAEPKRIEQFKAGKPLECVIIDFMTTPTVPPEQRSIYAEQLLFRILDVLQEWGEKGVEITKIYTSGGTEAGHRLMRSAGAKIINESQHEIHKHVKRTIYELDIATSTKHFLQPYKRALAEWKRDHTSQ